MTFYRPGRSATAKRVRIHFDYPLGDLVVLGGALRELESSYPGEFKITIESSFAEFWRPCPFVKVEPPNSYTKRIPGEIVIRHLYAKALEEANRRPRHLLQAFVDEINSKLRTRVKVKEFRGESWFKSETAASEGPVEIALGQHVPYWIVCNGGKFDRTVKWWPNSAYQQVVRALRSRVLFVQVGRSGDYHPRLKDTLDFRGGTDLATLLRLVYWAEGVLCPITSLMHLAAAVPRPPGVPGIRPCVVLGGGIEPPHLTAYPGHRFLSTVGALPCTGSGCWRARTFKLGDGRSEDDQDQLCLDVKNLHPHCMGLIQPAEVTRAISVFITGGAARALSDTERAAAQRSLGLVRGFALDETRFTRQTARIAIERQTRLIRNRQLGGTGQGIVTMASGIDYIASAWVLSGLLRDLGCQFPVEVWLVQNQEWLPQLRCSFRQFNARLRYFHRPIDPNRPRSSLFAIKSEIIAASSFREVFWIDADSFPIMDPTYLFNEPEYLSEGAVFWPDLADFRSTTPEAWEIFGLAADSIGPEVQGGELLIHKARAGDALLLARWCNRQYAHLYSFVGGDKDVFRLAFRKLGREYAMPTRCPNLVDGCLFNTDFIGRPLFQHRVGAKIRLGTPLAPVRGFMHHERCQNLLDIFTSNVLPKLRLMESDYHLLPQTCPVEVLSE